MGIEKFIQSVCVQTAVYWGAPVADGYGNKTYAEGVEIDCRWDIIEEVMMGNNGKTFISKTQVLVTQDLKVEGWLYLGTLDDLTALGLNALICNFIPNQVPGAFEIKRFTKTPMIKSTREWVRKVYL